MSSKTQYKEALKTSNSRIRTLENQVKLLAKSLADEKLKNANLQKAYNNLKESFVPKKWWQFWK